MCCTVVHSRYSNFNIWVFVKCVVIVRLRHLASVTEKLLATTSHVHRMLRAAREVHWAGQW